MKESVARKAILTVGAALILAGVAVAGEAKEARPRPAILAVYPYIKQETVGAAARPWLAGLRQDGYEVKVVPRLRGVTRQMLHQFNVLLLLQMESYDPTDRTQTDDYLQGREWYFGTRELESFKELLGAFLAEGGGVLAFSNAIAVLTDSSQSPGGIQVLLESFGGWPLFEQVLDARHAYQQPVSIRYRYAWTTNLASSPLLEGVRTVYYPAMGFMYGPATTPLKLSDEWQVLVRGMESAASHGPVFPGAFHAPAFVASTKGSYQKTPPLVAARQVGKGRLALSGIHSFFSLVWEGHPVTEDICPTRGDGVVRSDTKRLLRNILGWLAEPSLAQGAPGGYRTPAQELKPHVPPDWGKSRAIDWSKVAIGTQPRSYRGLIGAHTGAGGGKGTVADWVKAAKTAGLDWLAFTEQFSRLTAEQYEALKAACEQASGPDFLALPGFEIRDVAGNRWVQFGAHLGFPRREILDKEGKRIRDAQNFFFYSHTPPTAPIDVGHNPTPPHAYRFLNAFAVYTHERSKLLDHPFESYLLKQWQEQELEPIAVNLLYAPEELGGAVHLPLTRVRARNPEELRRFFVEPNWRPWSCYVSGGPEILSWDGFNTTRSTLGQYYVRGTERWRVRLEVHSDLGLKQVRVYDGKSLFARFLPEGMKDFDVNLDGLHDKSRRLVAVAEDRSGGTAVTHTILIVDYLGRLQICSDRNNYIPNSIVRGDKGRPVMYLPASMWDIGRYPELTSARPAEDGYFLGLPGLDGGFGGAVADMSLRPYLLDDSRKGELFCQLGSDIASGHVIIEKWDCENEFLPTKQNVRVTLNLTPYIPYRPLKDYHVTVREISFIKRVHDLSLVVVDGRIRFLRDVQFRDGYPSVRLGYIYPTPAPGENDHFALVLPGQKMLSGLLPPPDRALHFQGKVPAGSYFATFPGTTRSAQGVLVLDEGYFMNVGGSDKGVRAHVDLYFPGRRFAAGDALPYRFLFMVGGLTSPGTNEPFEWIRSSLGLAGRPAYDVEVSQGRLKGTRLFLDVEAEDGGAMVKLGPAHLPVRLPIRVYGLNPRWSTALYDHERGELVPFGVAEDGIGYTSIDLDRGPAEVYLGNLATCDVPELNLWVVEEGPIVKITVQNPLDKALKTTVQLAANYRRAHAFRKAITIPAGGLVSLTTE